MPAPSSTSGPSCRARSGSRSESPTAIAGFIAGVASASSRQAMVAVDGSASRWRADHLVLKGYAFRIVFRIPRLRGVSIRKDLEVIRVPDLFARIDVDQHGH